MTFLPPDPPMDGSHRAAKVAPESVLVAPRLPVTRWNRRYLLAAAGALAALVAAGFYIGFGGANARVAKQAPPPAADVTPSSPAISDRYARGYADPSVQAIALGGVSLPPPGGAPAPGGPVPAAPPPPPPPVDPAIQQARDQALAARSANPFFAAAPIGEDAETPAAPVSAAPPVPAPASPTPTADVQPANGQGGKRQFLAAARSDDYLANPLRAAESPWEVKAGTVIPAALITALNSDLPGEVIAQVTEPVYDHVTGRTVLIPQGSRLIGQYDSQIAYGQQRALIAWTRIIMPDGRSINIGSMSGADLSGAAGLQDRVDDHWGQLARGILLSTVFSVGAASAQDASARSSGSLVLNSAGTGVSTEAQEVGEQVTARDLNRQPTIKVRAGWPVMVLVNKDMILAPYP
jgi:type IV secretion system protein VirB10